MNQLVDAENFRSCLNKNETTFVYTDGACRGNPGPGGWGAILHQGEIFTELFGGEEQTTNNRMELFAAIASLEFMPEGSTLIIATDSQYLQNGVVQWMPKWKKNGWKTANNVPVKNQDLWLKIDTLCNKRVVSWTWIKGHTGNIHNERADIIAKQAIARLIMSGD
ncbi:MAG: ribonuclease HI [Holosporales bacterium]|jgi:ribonuclease HI|nr:ribonuclease HI [Holosporales bacterium]